ncbi:MAG TPA: DUF4136 domain-containing protein [Thermoanaerobaculia bacterium]|nr:DUF4136 domain-containing protein [Thermoanaerobaculia bacterium]
MRIAAGWALLFALAGCATGPEVTTNADEAADFSRYRTYAWREGVVSMDPAVGSRVQAAVDQELTEKGMQKVDRSASPDLLVYATASRDQERIIDPEQLGYEIGPGGIGSERVEVILIPVGSLLVDIVDAGTNRLVWRGKITKAMDRGPVSDRQLRDATRRLFRDYPASSHSG